MNVLLELASKNFHCILSKKLISCKPKTENGPRNLILNKNFVCTGQGTVSKPKIVMSNTPKFNKNNNKIIDVNPPLKSHRFLRQQYDYTGLSTQK